MRGPVLSYTSPPMPAAEQIESAAAQLEWKTRDLKGATWAIHPTDLEELRTVIGAAVHLQGRYFTIAADPELVGMGPRLVWSDEWPDEWSAKIRPSRRPV